MENNPDRFSVIARSRKQVARLHASRVRCDPPISARRSPSSRHLAPINAQMPDEPNMSDTTLLLTVEDLINIAAGPLDINRVNFKVLQKVLHILAGQMRVLEQKVEIREDDLKSTSAKGFAASAKGDSAMLQGPSQEGFTTKKEFSDTAPRSRSASLEIVTREQFVTVRDKVRALLDRARIQYDVSAFEDKRKKKETSEDGRSASLRSDRPSAQAGSAAALIETLTVEQLTTRTIAVEKAVDAMAEVLTKLAGDERNAIQVVFYEILFFKKYVIVLRTWSAQTIYTGCKAELSAARRRGHKSARSRHEQKEFKGADARVTAATAARPACRAGRDSVRCSLNTSDISQWDVLITADAVVHGAPWKSFDTSDLLECSRRSGRSPYAVFYYKMTQTTVGRVPVVLPLESVAFGRVPWTTRVTVCQCSFESRCIVSGSTCG
ncbi:hypothetical protein EVAR_60813_1 [Eumeta japonica]|uniref:Uncharacterized protein n=1 Tax=Eumeta variegata TaxID=151549 RepID=A0A4C1YN06_EUMVA|nr:hypothetical protein EVAR_60813_1 [Eumeta japonica]